jgi:glycosyltransferase involved in cell wall biosynthesis
VRIGIYADLLYRADNDGISTDRAFIRFLSALAERVDAVVVFGRLDPVPGRAPYGLPAQMRFVALPYYPRVTAVRSLLGGLRDARRVFAAELERLDAVWVFGPHPVALGLVHVARRQGVPVVLGIRQNFPEYIARRLPGRAWAWAIPAAHLLDHAFRALAGRMPTVVVGEALARRYGGERARNLHVTGISLVPRSAVLSEAAALDKRWNGEIRLLSVGRLDAEKNPLLLPEILARLNGGDGPWQITAVGTGQLVPAVERRAAELGVASQLALTGYIPQGRRLDQAYRASHAFLHVSHTEGLPQVMFEAQAAGLPVVATDVGGVGEALGHGARGLLIPPGDANAAAEACRRLRGDPALRERLIRGGLEFAREHTVEAQLDRLIPFLEEHARP